MKKISLCLSLIILCIGCKNLIFNTALQKIGAYDDALKLEKLTSKSKEVVFVPMIHLGTEMLYKDVKKKIDSLDELGYFFYCEKVKANLSDTITLRKFRKINKQPLSEDGYKGTIDSILAKKFKVKLKKKLINQPTYLSLGVDSLNGRNVDVSLKDIITHYENKYGEIKLEPCDFKTSIYKETVCDDKKTYPKLDRTILVDFRNDNLLKELQNEKHSKIAIIYGKGHFKGIKEQLLKIGYK